MTGFDRELRQKVIDFDAHILVSTEDILRDWRTLKTKIDNTPGRGRDRSLHPGTGDRGISEPAARAADARCRSRGGRESNSAAKIHQLRQARS